MTNTIDMAWYRHLDGPVYALGWCSIGTGWPSIGIWMAQYRHLDGGVLVKRMCNKSAGMPAGRRRKCSEKNEHHQQYQWTSLDHIGDFEF